MFKLRPATVFGLAEKPLKLSAFGIRRSGNGALYGKILGLDQIADVDLPGDWCMIRFRDGESELKFIVEENDQPRMAGGLYNARGIRLLGLVLSYARRDGIIERMQFFSVPAPKFTDDKVGPNSISRGMTQDSEGNQIELVLGAMTHPIS